MREKWKFQAIFCSLLSLRALLPAEDGGLESIPDRESDDSAKEIAASEVGFSLFSKDDSRDPDQGYTINFKNVSIKEYLHFISKIAGTNFVYDDAELNFNVTVVSEEQLSMRNIMSALAQMLRIHGLNLIEEGDSLIITRSPGIAEFAALDLNNKGTKEKNPAVITKLFRVKNANIVAVAGIIKPMISAAAIMDALPETRQLIITDVPTNIDKIAELIKKLDSSESPLEIEIYKACHMPPATLIDLTKQIVAPFAGTNPLIFVPQNETSSIFLVSTPALVEKIVEIMEDLDVKPKSLTNAQLTRDQVYLYKIENKSHAELIDALKQISKELQESGTQSVRLIDALENVKWVRTANSLLFITDTETQGKLLDILKTLDTLSGSRNFYVYKIQQAAQAQVEGSLAELGKSLKKSSSDLDLVEAIQTMRYIKEINSIVFTGSDEALKKLAALLPTFDVALAQYSPSSHYMLYTPLYLSGKEIEKALEDIKRNLHSSGLSDEALINAVESMKWVPSTNTLLFTGDPGSLAHIESIIKLVDIPAGAQSRIFIYQPKNVSNEQIEEALDELADKLDHKNISDRNLANAIDHMTWVPESQAFLFKSDPGTIEKIQGFLTDLDNPKEAQAIAQTYFLYNLKYGLAEDVLSHLESVAKGLPTKDPSQKAVVGVIDKASLLKETNSILLTGSIKAVEDVKALIAQFDQPNAVPVSMEKTAFFIYKPQHLSPVQLKAALQETANDLKDAGLFDALLLNTIQTARIIESTGTLAFTGSADSLQKTKEILTFVDVPTTGGPSLGEFAGKAFFLYRARNMPAAQLLTMLNNLVAELAKENPKQNQDLTKTVKGAKVIEETNSLLFTGPSNALQKISELINELDVSGSGVTSEPISYIVYKPVNVSGPELIEMMKEFEQNLISTGVRDPGLFAAIEHLKFIEKTALILVSGDQQSVDKALELLKKFDLPGLGTGVTTLTHLETSFLVYKLQYHDGAELQTTLRQIAHDLSTADPNINRNLIHAINSTQWIKVTNSLLATGTPDVLTRIRELVQNLDVPLRQVFIEVLIIETTIANNQQFGLQWGGKAQYLNRFAIGTGNFPSPNPLTGGANQTINGALNSINATTTPTASMIPVPNSPAGGFDLGVIGDIILHKGKSFISLASLVNALQQDTDSVVVMNPKIIGQDNQQSTIFVGQNIPFAGSTVSTLGVGAQQTATNLEYRDVGISLTITPILGKDDIVTIDISNDITQQIENTTSGVNGITGLQTSHTSLTARVHVPNNHFVAYSGMLQDQKTHFKSSIPCLGGLPVIGAIFSENDRVDAKNNLIFFIRPSIIDSVEDFKRITEAQECLYKEQAIKHIVKEEIDDGIGWVKTPDDEY